MNQPHVDENVLNELAEMLEDDFADLLSTYLRDAQVKISALSSGLEGENWEEVRKVSHSLKGSSVNLGILQLSALCHELENAALNNEFDRCLPLFTAITAETDTVTSFLEQKLT